MLAHPTLEDEDIVVRQETREGGVVYVLLTPPGTVHYLLPTREEAVAHAVAFAMRQRVRAWLSSEWRDVVLLVQVRDDGLEMYTEFLRYSGLAPIAVSSVKDTLMFAPEADIIVTGIVLNDHVDGVELVSRLRRDDGTMHKPIIVLSACVWWRDRDRAERAGCDVFLPKPCLPDALLREVRMLLPTSHDTAA